MKIMLIAISIMFLTFGFYSITKADPTTIYVYPGESIQDVINAANPGDTIYVYNGIYNENIVINKTINLIGEDKNTTIIDGGSNGDVIFLNESYVNISGFTIQNSGGSNTHGLVIIDKNHCRIFGNIFTDNFIGINIHENSVDNLFYHNNFIINNFINAIDYSNKQNQWDDGTEGNYWDDYTGTDSNGDGIGDEAYTLIGPYKCKDNKPIMYPWQISKKTIYVNDDNTGGPWDGTEQHPYEYIQDALDNSLAGDTVYVYNGTYYENLFVDKAINLIGENRNNTIIDGSDNGNVVEVYVYNLKISGFTIQNSGGYNTQGLIIWDTGYNEITDNIFMDNYMGVNLKGNSFDNNIHHNYFIDNTYNAYDYTECDHQWDDGTEGNYWDDYTGEDNNDDGIGDTPYIIQGPYECEDGYPLMIFPGPNNPPYTPSNPTPQNGKTSININQDLSWSGGDPDAGDIVTYDVYFGTTNPPVKKSSNQSSTTYNPGTMNYSTNYYWQIVSWDNHGESSIGPIWSFTTGSESSGGGGGGGGGPYIPPNKKPVANASASDKTGTVNTPVIFNGSLSLDEDGDIINYTWDFDDGTYGYEELTSHIYSNTGSYNVKLTVTDNYKAKDSHTFTVVIRKTNIPPNIPQVEGPTAGKQNIDYTFTAYANDPDNDNIQYIFNWDDNQTTETSFLPNGTISIEKHKWTTSGIFNIKIFAIDSNYASSDPAELRILINVVYCQDIGHLIDENNDKIYDTFYSNKTGLMTSLVYDGKDYLIDTDGDGIENYYYNLETNVLTKIVTPEKDEIPIDENIILYLLALLIIVIIIILIIIGKRPKHKVKDKKEKPKEEKPSTKKTKTRKKGEKPKKQPPKKSSKSKKKLNQFK